jgi:hypothetical protein
VRKKKTQTTSISFQPFWSFAYFIYNDWNFSWEIYFEGIWGRSSFAIIDL